MRILFVHNNFPGQYRRLLRYIESNPKLGVEVNVATLQKNEQKFKAKRVFKFKPHRDATQGIHPSLIATERAVLQGHALYGAFLNSKDTSFKPDLIMSHSGWGSNMFLKDMFPDAKLLTYYEWYYHARGGDVEFLNNKRSDANDAMRIRMKNNPILQDLAVMDHGQCPTSFQHSRLPEVFRSKVSVLHDGVDTEFFQPNPKIKVRIGEHTFSAEDEVITYVARGMEEYRGFPEFMRMVNILQKQRPNVHVVIVGDDRVAYGAQRKDGKSWKEAMLEELPELDHSRIHFTGLQPLQMLKGLFQITRAHVYLTVPFVLSWSMLEAMAAGALIVGSDTEPVRELINHGENGVLVPFFDVEKQANTICHILDNKADYEPLKQKARETILENYAVNDLLPKYWQLIESVANGTKS
ncbi:glycosyltransferase [Kordiimonas sp. SCSIO 12603]|uniref:glycosyltransferase n=1 Tax=Kordiimonas sp. SCSIO 12603 TaxID=2829596 RepID=UPI002107511D|nr:glycosyltransferase [Kordiimonas sp. SCSIO 12603]UTW60045.1 glycosyltransferase [Kordiimonas sp. SCSIO 12603]